MRNPENRKFQIVPIVLAMTLLLSFLPSCTTDGPSSEATARITAEHSWNLTDDWTIALSDTGEEVLTAQSQSSSSAWNDDFVLRNSWSISTGIQLLDSAAGQAQILLGDESCEASLRITVTYEDSRHVVLGMDLLKSSVWKNIYSGESLSIREQSPVNLIASHIDGEAVISVTVSQDEQILTQYTSEELSQRILSPLVKAGVGANAAPVQFVGFHVSQPSIPESAVDQLLETIKPGDPDFYRSIAELAVEDMVGNFWTGDTQSGHLAPTWNGLPGDDLPDPRGSIWETSMMVFGIYDIWFVTGDEYYMDLLLAEADFFRENFTAEELENAGGLFNWASDDCSWNAMMMLCFYTVTEDEWFFERAINLLDNANARWYNEELNGLYYKDGVDYMSLYEVGIALSWLRIWEITGEQRFYDLALRSYEGMQTRLGRDDGLYFCEANVHWTLGDRNSINEAGSSSFLTGNMGMAALSAKFYKITGNQEYLDRMYLTNQGLLSYYDKDGVLLNDRDAWTNGTFAAFYVSEVLSMPDTEEMQELINNTALSIVTNARTDDGYYGGSWSGPAEGSQSIWYSKGSVPQQCNTTGTSVMMVTAAAILEVGIDNYVR